MNDYQKIILRFLKFYNYVDRPMSFLDIAHHLESSGIPLPPNKISQILKELITKNFVFGKLGFYSISPDVKTDDRRRQDVLFDRKWKKFLRHVFVFRFIPFAEAAFAAGSMSLGNVHEKSDFDVLIIAREGRIFTTRFLLILALNFLGLRRNGLDDKNNVSDKICLNHFVTSNSLRLNEPRNLYWHELYYNLVPIYGDFEIISKFFKNNDWVGRRPYLNDRRHNVKFSLIKYLAEKILGGFPGNYLEKILRKIQLQKINKGLIGAVGYKARLRISKDELEFHPDTRRIENWIGILD